MRAKQINGNVKTIQKLQRLRKEATRDGAYRVSCRIHAVLLNIDGYSAPQIADILQVHRTNVCIWIRRWEESGFEGLLEGYRPGRPSCLDEKQIEKLENIIESGPIAYGFNSGVWTCPMVAWVIEEEFSVSYHPAHVSKILHRMGFSVQRPRKELARADPEKQSRWVRYTYPSIKKKSYAEKPS